MAFWSTPLKAGRGDPKRKYRFTVQFDGLSGVAGGPDATPVTAGGSVDSAGIIWFAKSVNKPSITVTETDHTFLDKKFYFPGRVEWDTITLTLVDPAEGVNGMDAVRQMNEIITRSGYKMFKNAQDLGTMSKAKAAGGLGTVVINQINDEGKPIETWTLKNAFAKSLKFGDLDYTGDELIELTIEMRYDWAVCEIKSDGEKTDSKFYDTTS